MLIVGEERLQPKSDKECSLPLISELKTFVCFDIFKLKWPTIFIT